MKIYPRFRNIQESLIPSYKFSPLTSPSESYGALREDRCHPETDDVTQGMRFRRTNRGARVRRIVSQDPPDSLITLLIDRWRNVAARSWTMGDPRSGGRLDSLDRGESRVDSAVDGAWTIPARTRIIEAGRKSYSAGAWKLGEGEGRSRIFWKEEGKSGEGEISVYIILSFFLFLLCVYICIFAFSRINKVARGWERMRILRNVFLSIQNIFHVFENKLNILRARTTARCCQGLESMKFLFNFGEKIVSIIIQRLFINTIHWYWYELSLKLQLGSMFFRFIRSS